MYRIKLSDFHVNQRSTGISSRLGPSMFLCRLCLGRELFESTGSLLLYLKPFSISNRPRENEMLYERPWIPLTKLKILRISIKIIPLLLDSIVNASWLYGVGMIRSDTTYQCFYTTPSIMIITIIIIITIKYLLVLLRNSLISRRIPTDEYLFPHS